MRDAAIDTHRQAARAARSRSAGAPPLDDMVGEGPVSRGAARGAPRGIDSAAVAAQRLGGGRISRARARPAPSLVTRLRARVPRVRPLKVLTVGAFGVALVGIVTNAMVFQRGHHPSPLFGLGRPAGGADDAAQRAAASVPPPAAPAPVENTGAIPPAAPVEAPPAAAVAPKPAPAHHAAKPRRDEAAKPANPTAAQGAPAHPRPGRPAPAEAEGRPDPVAKLLGEAGHPAKPAVGKRDAKAAAKAPAKPDGKPAADTASHPHHHVVAVSGDGKPAAKAE